ncbi:MAG: TPM domain-containing protein [Bacteroidia bacterium]|nr:TPM domain-containing protein [Bacteroidia bacterium]
MRKLNVLLFALLAAAIWACTGSSEGRIYVADDANVLTASQRDSLVAELKDLESRIGSQMAIKVIDSLGDATVESYAANLAETWKLGRESYNDGIVIVVSITDKKIRIEVGSGLEQIITNGVCTRIIGGEMAPLFREEKYFDGLMLAVQEIKGLIAGNTGLIGKPA